MLGMPMLPLASSVLSTMQPHHASQANATASLKHHERPGDKHKRLQKKQTDSNMHT